SLIHLLLAIPHSIIHDGHTRKYLNQHDIASYPFVHFSILHLNGVLSLHLFVHWDNRNDERKHLFLLLYNRQSCRPAQGFSISSTLLFNSIHFSSLTHYLSS